MLDYQRLYPLIAQLHLGSVSTSLRTPEPSRRWDYLNCNREPDVLISLQKSIVESLRRRLRLLGVVPFALSTVYSSSHYTALTTESSPNNIAVPKNNQNGVRSQKISAKVFIKVI